MDVMTQAELIAKIDAFLERHAMPESTFGREATGEPGLVGRIRDGSSPTLKLLGRIADFMERKDAEQGEAGTDTAQPDAGSEGADPFAKPASRAA